MLLCFIFITALAAKCICIHCRDSCAIVPAAAITPYSSFDHRGFCSQESQVQGHISIAQADITAVPIGQFSDAVYELSIQKGWTKLHTLQNLTLAMNGEFAELAEVVIPILDNCTKDYTFEIAEEVSDIVVYAILVAGVTNQSINEVLLTASGTTSLSRVPAGSPCGLRTLLQDMLCSVASLNMSPHALGDVLLNACRLYAHFRLDPNECLFGKIVHNEYKKKGVQQNFTKDGNRVIAAYAQ